jgi:hypothetical protein
MARNITLHLAAANESLEPTIGDVPCYTSWRGSSLGVVVVVVVLMLGRDHAGRAYRLPEDVPAAHDPRSSTWSL